MKFTAKRLLAAGAVGLATVITPLTLAVALPGVSTLPSSVAGAATGTPANPDEILYGQTTGSPSTFFRYVPGDGSTTTTQSVSPKGQCGAPSVSGAAILSVTAKLYAASPSANYYSNKPSADTPGISGLATGVCGVSPAWSIENKSGKGAESLDFAPGSNAVIGSNRIFTGAQIPIQRKDSGVAQHPVLTVQLVEFDSAGNQVGTQTCSINGGQGTSIIADTSVPAGGPCTGTPAPQAGFQTVEVQDATVSSSISVVGPTATFELASVICGGQSIQPTNLGGNVQATLTLTGAATQCKSYTSFSSTIDPNTGLATLSFNGFSTSSVQLTVHIVWPAVPLCSPYVDAPGSPAPGGTTGIPNVPGLAQNMCPVHSFSFDNTTFYDQAYCQTAQAPGPGVVPQQELCTVTKDYNNDVVNADGTVTPITTSTGAPGTQITEDWVGLVDMRLH